MQPRAGGLPISSAVADQAAEWLTLLMSGEASDEDRRRWQHWRAEHTEHERAWQHIEAVTQRLKLVEPRAGYQALSPYADARSSARRKALNVLLWGSFTGVGAVLVSRTQTWQQQVADHRTGTGEQRTVTLQDGTLVTLNTASAVNVRYDNTQRLLRLVAGEVLIVTGHTGRKDGAADDPRPFVAITADARIQALGTRFILRQHEGHTSVAVQEGAVKIHPVTGEQQRIVRAGERTSVTRHEVATPQALTKSGDAWARGQIVAEDMPLGEFLEELGRYRPGFVRCDPAVAGLRVSGVFPLAGTERILATLPSVLPVQVRFQTRFWVVVEPKS